MSWQLVYTRQAQKDSEKLASAGLREKATNLLEVLREDPFRNPPSYEIPPQDLSLLRE